MPPGSHSRAARPTGRGHRRLLPPLPGRARSPTAQERDGQTHAGFNRQEHRLLPARPAHTPRPHTGRDSSSKSPRPSAGRRGEKTTASPGAPCSTVKPGGRQRPVRIVAGKAPGLRPHGGAGPGWTSLCARGPRGRGGRPPCAPAASRVRDLHRASPASSSQTFAAQWGGERDGAGTGRKGAERVGDVLPLKFQQPSSGACHANGGTGRSPLWQASRRSEVSCVPSWVLRSLFPSCLLSGVCVAP